MHRSLVLGFAIAASGCSTFVGVDASDDDAVSAGSTSSTDPTAASDGNGDSAPASGSGSTGSGNPNTSASTSVSAGPTSGDPTVGDDTTTATSSDGGSSSSSSSSDGGSSSSSSSTGDMGDDLLGMPCENDANCDLGAGQECCTDSNCIDTCMVPCDTVDQCPFDNMGCEHGYCLFECNNNDADCVDWPSYTCQHGGTLCEL